MSSAPVFAHASVSADALDVLGHPVVEQLAEDEQRRAARQQIAAVGAAVIPVRDRVRHVL